MGPKEWFTERKEHYQWQKKAKKPDRQAQQ